MTLAEFYAKLEGFEGGGDLVAFVKSEMAKANGEAKTHREAKESLATQLSALTGERDELKAKLSKIEEAGGQGQSELKRGRKGAGASTKGWNWWVCEL